MNGIELLMKRRSVRAFYKKEVDRETIKKVLETALMSPSAGNVQPWKLCVVVDDEVKHKLADACYGQKFVEDASFVVVVVALPFESALRYGNRGKHLYSIQDTAALTTYILLSAKAYGFDSCWVGAFSDEKVSRLLGLRNGEIPVAVVPIGYGAESPYPPPRKSLDKICIWF